MTNVPTGAAISLALISKIVGKMTKAQTANAQSVVVALERYGSKVGLLQPHRLAQFLAQILHESGAFRYDREVWGPTPAQKRYDTRTDLGNTPAMDGDGFLFRGRTGIQITGRTNTRAFRDWCRDLMAGSSLIVPDFEKNPDAMLTDPWEGLGPIWYWDTRKLSRYADAGDIEMITKKINGGLNGYQDRLDWFTRVALVMLGYEPNGVAAFQKWAGEKVDGDAGPRTRAALHRALLARTAPASQSKDVQAAPVIEEKEVEKQTVPATVDHEVKKKTTLWGWLTGIFGSGGAGAAAFLGMDWQTVIAIGGLAIVMLVVVILLRRQIIAAVQDIRGAVEG